MDHQSDIKSSNNDEIEIINSQKSNFSPVKTPSKPQNMWTNILMSISKDYESKDSTIKEVIDLLISKKNIPRTETKFIAYINDFKMIKNNPNYANIIWDLISSHCDFNKYKSTKDSPLKTDSQFLDFEIINHHLAPEDLELMQTLEKKRKSNVMYSQPENNNWVSELKNKLGSFQTDDEDLKSIISFLSKKSHFPQSEFKFINFIKELPKGEKYVKVLCDIIKDFKKPNSPHKSAWTEIVIEHLEKYETTNENLNAAIKYIMGLKTIPMNESKFIKFAMTSPSVKMYSESAKMIWDIISPLLPKLLETENGMVEEKMDTALSNNKKRENKKRTSEIESTPKRKKLDISQTIHEFNVNNDSSVVISNITEKMDIQDHVGSVDKNVLEEVTKKTNTRKRLSKVKTDIDMQDQNRVKTRKSSKKL